MNTHIDFRQQNRNTQSTYFLTHPVHNCIIATTHYSVSRTFHKSIEATTKVSARASNSVNCWTYTDYLCRLNYGVDSLKTSFRLKASIWLWDLCSPRLAYTLLILEIYWVAECTANIFEKISYRKKKSKIKYTKICCIAIPLLFPD